MHGSDDNLPRLLEILDIICGDNGEAYAHQLKSVLKSVEGDGPLKKRTILQGAVEEMLVRIHAGMYFDMRAHSLTLRLNDMPQPTLHGGARVLVFYSLLSSTRTAKLDRRLWSFSPRFSASILSIHQFPPLSCCEDYQPALPHIPVS